MKFLHIYGQQSWHDEAYIVGNKQALTELRDALNKAIDNKFGAAYSFVSDGEGFTTHIVCHETDRMEKLQLPYNRFSEQAHGRYPSSLLPEPNLPEEEIHDDKEWFSAQRKFGFDYEK